MVIFFLIEKDFFKIMKKILKILLLIFISETLLFSQENLSLEEAMKIGLENNYQISISKRNLEVSENNNSWGAVGFLPKIDASLSETARWDYQDTTSSQTNAFSSRISMSWLLFDGFGMQINKKKLENLEIISKGNVDIIIENTIENIILSYYRCILEKEKLKVVEEVKSLSKDRYNYIKSKKEFGASVTYDVLQAKNSFLSDSSNFLLQKINYENSIKNLKLLIGEGRKINYNFTEGLEINLLNYDFDILLKKLFNQNKSLKNQLLSINIQTLELDFQKSRYYPTVSLNSGFDFNSSNVNPESKFLNNIKNKTHDFYITLSVNINIFNGGNTERAIQNTKIQQDIMNLENLELRHTLKNALSNLLSNYNLRKDLYKVSNESFETAKLNLQISNEKYKSGAINSFNYRDIQVIYLNSAFNKLQASYNLIDAETEMLKTVGEINLK